VFWAFQVPLISIGLCSVAAPRDGALATRHPLVASEVSEILKELKGKWAPRFIDRCSVISATAAVLGWKEAMSRFKEWPDLSNCTATGVGWSGDEMAINTFLDDHPQSAKLVLTSLVLAGHGSDALRIALSRESVDGLAWQALATELYLSGDMERAGEALQMAPSESGDNRSEYLRLLKARRETIVSKQMLLRKVPGYWRYCFPWELTRNRPVADIDRGGLEQTLRDRTVSDEEKCRAACQFGLMSLNESRDTDIQFAFDAAVELIEKNDSLRMYAGVPSFLQAAALSSGGDRNFNRSVDDRIKLALLLNQGKVDEAVRLFDSGDFVSHQTISLMSIYLAENVSDSRCVGVLQRVSDVGLRLELFLSVLLYSPLCF
jgi:hypothetical protein